MADDKRSPSRVGKPLVYGEIIISEPIYVQQLAAAREEGRAAGYAEAIEKCAALAKKYDDDVCCDSFCGTTIAERIT